MYITIFWYLIKIAENCYYKLQVLDTIFTKDCITLLIIFSKTKRLKEIQESKYFITLTGLHTTPDYWINGEKLKTSYNCNVYKGWSNCGFLFLFKKTHTKCSTSLIRMY